MDCSGGEEEAQVMSAEEKREREERARARERERERDDGVGPKNATNGFSFDPVHTGAKSGILSHDSRTKSPPHLV